MHVFFAFFRTLSTFGVNKTTYDTVWGELGTVGATWPSLQLLGEAWTTMINAFIWNHKDHPLENGLDSSIAESSNLISDIVERCPKATICLPDIEFLSSSLRSRLGCDETTITEGMRAQGIWQAQGTNDERRLLVAQAIPRLSSVCDGRSLFWTDRGNIGMSHVSLSSCDEVWLLEGSSVPFVLRRSRENRMTMIGEAFVDGMMFGELWSCDEGWLEDVVLE